MSASRPSWAFRDDPMLLTGGPLPETVLSHLGGAGGGAHQILSFLDPKTIKSLGLTDREFRDMQQAFLQRASTIIQKRPYTQQFFIKIIVQKKQGYKKFQEALGEFKFMWKVADIPGKPLASPVNAGFESDGPYVPLRNRNEYIQEMIQDKNFQRDFSRALNKTHFQGQTDFSYTLDRNDIQILQSMMLEYPSKKFIYDSYDDKLVMRGYLSHDGIQRNYYILFQPVSQHHKSFRERHAWMMH